MGQLWDYKDQLAVHFGSVVLNIACLSNSLPNLTYLTAQHCNSGMSNLALKLGQIGPKWDKSGTFKISFSTFWLGEQILKSHRFVLFGANLTQF